MSNKKMKDNKFIVLMIFAIFVVAFNFLFILNSVFGFSSIFTSAGTTGTSGTKETPGAMLPYGVTFDSAGYEQLLSFDKSITMDNMTPDQKQRFINIGTMNKTGCGPCCSIQDGPALDASGNARCSCGHIHALIGLMKILVTKYGDKYTNSQIFNEIVQWKKLFFPGQIADDGSVIK